MSLEIKNAQPRAWAEISLSALRHNLLVAKEMSSHGSIMAVVKAGAYGHGLEKIAQTFEQEGVEFLGVANIGEARRIRNSGVKARIYLLGATWAGEREEIVARDITSCISSLDEAKHFNEVAKIHGKLFKVHISVDTGMGRGGFIASKLSSLMEELKKFENLEIEGVGSHLSSADEDEEFTKKQFQVFEAAIEQLGGVNAFRWRHMANSAGILGYDSGVCNLARPGIMLYGVASIPDYQFKLKNVMTLKSRVTLLRDIPKGHGVSYGRSYVTPCDMRIATIGIGYGDGYPRHVSGHGAAVWINGYTCPILGRVTMDQMMIDVTSVSTVQEGDEVELFGENITVTEVARQADTIAWEIFTGITPRVERVYL